MRKTIAALTVLLPMFVLSTTSAQSTLDFVDRVYFAPSGGQFRYRLYLPDGYEDAGRSYPTVTWINGASGDVGDRPQSLVDTLRAGEYAGFLIEPFGPGSPFHTCRAPDEQPHVHCVPELPRSTEYLLGAIEEVESIYPADPTRRVLSGFSAGGVATFNTIREQPDFFSAAVPFGSGHEARRFREPIDTRIWAIHGNGDFNLSPYYTSSTVEAIAQQGTAPIYLQPQIGHTVPDWFFEDIDNEVYRWMFEGVEPSLGTLLYNPANGNVIIDATRAPGGAISRLSLRVQSPPAIDSIGPDQLEMSNSFVRYTAADGLGFDGVVDLGPVLPAGLDYVEANDFLGGSTYDSFATERPGRTFRIEFENEPSSPLRKSIEEEPWIAYQLRDNRRARDQGTATRSEIGGVNDMKLIHKYSLPEINQEDLRLSNATMRIYLDDSSGDGRAVIRHSLADNDMVYDPDDYDDPSYDSSPIDFVTTEDKLDEFYDLDVTEFIKADYASGARNPVSAFRFEAASIAEEIPEFRIRMSKDRERFPSLRLSFLSSEVDCVPDALLSKDDLACVSTEEARDLIIEEIDSLLGDLDGNGNVDFQDFLTLAANFGINEPSYTAGNIDLRGGVDFADFLILSKNFSADEEIRSVPEPTSVELLIQVLFVGLIATGRRRRSCM